MPLYRVCTKSNVYIKRKLRVWRVQTCIPLVGAKTSLTCARLQTTPSQVSQYRTENKNLRKFGSTFFYGTVFAPQHHSNVYIKKKLRPWRVHKCISLVSAKTPLTCMGLQMTPSHVSQYWAENGNLQNSLFPWYRTCTKAMFILAPKQCLYQRKLRVWRVQNCIPLVGAKTSLTCAGLQTTPSQVSEYRAGNGNLRKSGSTFCHVTVFAPKQSLYQKEATGMESPKMYSSRRSKNFTHLCGTANDPSHVSQYRAETINLQKSGSTFYHGTVFAQKQYLYQK